MIKTFEFHWTKLFSVTSISQIICSPFACNTLVQIHQHILNKYRDYAEDYDIILGDDAIWLMHFQCSFKSPSVVLDVQFVMPVNV